MAFIFLSHSTFDKDKIVRPLYKYLSLHGVQCFLDERNIEWGDSIPESIRTGLNRVADDPAGYLLLVVSTASLSSRWLTHELHEAEMFRSKKDYGYILPVVLPDVNQNEAQRIIGRSIRYIVSDDPIEIGSALVGVIARRQPLTPRIRWNNGERDLDPWDFGLLEFVKTRGKLVFRWWEDSRWGILLVSQGQSYFQVFRSIISPLLDLSEAGLLLRQSGQLFDDWSEEFQTTQKGDDVLQKAAKNKCWSWEHRMQLDDMQMIPLDKIIVGKQ